MKGSILAANAWFAAELRRLNGGHLPAICSRFPNRFCQLLPQRVRGDLVPGISMEFDLDDEFQRALYLRGRYSEMADIDAMAQICAKEGTMFIDVGANIGIYTFSLLSRLPSLAVCAFEPNPKTFQTLLQTSRGHHFPNLKLIPLGLSDMCGVAEFHMSRVNSGWSTFGALGTLSRQVDAMVEVTSFDAWWAVHGREFPAADRYAIKMDVEGFERRVLSGMRHFLDNSHVCVILIELFDAALRNTGSSVEEVYDLLVDCGFTGYHDGSWRDRMAGPPVSDSPVNAFFRRESEWP